MKKYFLLFAFVTLIAVNAMFLGYNKDNNVSLRGVFLSANAWPEEPFDPSSEIQGAACYMYVYDEDGNYVGQIYTGQHATDCFDNYVVTTTCTPIDCDDL